MKAFFRKLKKSKLSIRLIYYFVVLLFLVSYILFTKSLLSLSNIETTIRIIVIITLGTLLLIYWFIDLLLLLSKKNAAVVVISVFAMLISCVSIVGSIYIDKAHGYICKLHENILKYKRREMSKIHLNMQMVFQDPYSSLDPRMSVRNLISEPVEVCGLIKNKAELSDHVSQIMEMCGLPADHANLYPHELDGGLRQRIGLARAMAVSPKFIVCDEPVSSLDVSIQAQILNLLMDLQDQRGLAYMFITHDLCVVKHISNEIMVMYMGQTVEYARTKDLFANPAHPYTRALLAAVPTIDISKRGKEHFTLKGEVSSPIDPAPGCRFAPRCPYATDACRQNCSLREVEPGHYVACRLFQD